MLFVFGNYVITNSLEIIRKEYEGKDIKYPVEIINIQKKINDQLGLYRGARKLIGLLSILAIFFFMTIYADRRKVTIILGIIVLLLSVTWMGYCNINEDQSQGSFRQHIMPIESLGHSLVNFLLYKGRDNVNESLSPNNLE